MVNIGKPSGGCYSCRRMRVKCDERRPGCERCERGSRECPGYRDDLPIFRSMNEASETLALFPRQKRKNQNRKATPSPTPPVSGGRVEKRSHSQSPHRRASASSSASSRAPTAEPQRRLSSSPLKHSKTPTLELPGSVSTNWEEAAVAYYLNHFIIRPEDGSKEAGGRYFDCLPELLSEASSGAAPHLEVAVKSVALSLVGNQSCMEQLKVQARRYYGEALCQVNVALDDFKMAKADATLATLILLGQYEIISGDRPGHALWTSHGEGQTALLGLRGVESLRWEERSRQLFRIAQVGLQLSNVAAHPSRKPWRVDPQQQPPPSPPPADLFPDARSRQFYDFNDEAFATHRTVHALMREEWRGDAGWHDRVHAAVRRQHALVRRGAAITRACREESKESPPMFWRADSATTLLLHPATETETGSPHAIQSHLPRSVYLFPDILTASNLLYFWALVAKVLDSMVVSAAILEAAHVTLPSDLHPATLRRQLSGAIDDACAAIPFVLGEVDARGHLTVAGTGSSCVGAYHALWPLHVLCSLRHLDAARRDWLLARLAQVDAGFGIRQAALLRDYWLQRAVSAGGAADWEEDEPNAGPGSVWFPI